MLPRRWLDRGLPPTERTHRQPGRTKGERRRGPASLRTRSSPCPGATETRPPAAGPSTRRGPGRRRGERRCCSGMREVIRPMRWDLACQASGLHPCRQDAQPGSGAAPPAPMNLPVWRRQRTTVVNGARSRCWPMATHADRRRIEESERSCSSSLLRSECAQSPRRIGSLSGSPRRESRRPSRRDAARQGR